MGRNDLLTRLHDQLQSNERIGITGVRGMGGIGKTELALQYAIENVRFYPGGVCWLQARDQEIATQIVSFARANLGIKPPDDLEADEQVRFTWQRWPQGDSLLVLDDVTDYNAIAPYLPPSDPRLKVLITTRLNLGSSVKAIEIEELSDEAAIALLKSIAGDERIESQIDDAEKLSEWVGNLPLGLELVGRFLARKPDWAIAKLLKRLEDKRLDAKALVAGESGMTASLGVAAALDLSWAELNEQEQDLACLLGMFAIAPVPWTLVEQCFEDDDPDEVEEWRDGLRDRSLIKRVDERVYQLHQIVQEFFREKLKEKGDDAIALKQAFGRVMVAQAQILDETPTLDQIEEVRGAISHLEEMAHFWIFNLNDEDFILPFVGIIYFYNGQFNYQESLSWANRCCELSKARFNEAHAEFAHSLGYLADVYRSKSNIPQALETYQRKLKIQKKNYGELHVDIARTLAKIAASYKDQGKFQTAETNFDKALKILDDISHEDPLDILPIRNNLALVYAEQGLYLKAKSEFEEVLRISKLTYGQDHQEVIPPISNLAATCAWLGEYDAAEAYHRQAIALKKQKFGELHPKVSDSLNNLGFLFLEQKRYLDAQPLFQQALEIGEKFHGVEHREVATTMNNLGMSYEGLGKDSIACELFEKALAIKRATLGENSHEIAPILSNIANIRCKEENYRSAEVLYLEALRIRLNTLNNQHPSVAKSYRNLCYAYLKQGKFSQAKCCLGEALRISDLNSNLRQNLSTDIRYLLNNIPKGIKPLPLEDLGL